MPRGNARHAYEKGFGLIAEAAPGFETRRRHLSSPCSWVGAFLVHSSKHAAASWLVRSPRLACCFHGVAVGNIDQHICELYVPKSPDVEEARGSTALSEFFDVSFAPSDCPTLLEEVCECFRVLPVCCSAHWPHGTQHRMVAILIDILLAAIATFQRAVAATPRRSSDAETPTQCQPELLVCHMHAWYRCRSNE